MEEKYHGLVLSAVNYGESDKILNIYTLEKGVISARIKGVKKATAKLRFAGEPFCFAEYIIHTALDKNSVIGASLIDSFYPLRENLEKFYCGAVILEFVRKFEKAEIVSTSNFSLVIDALKSLCYGKENPKSVLVKFLISDLRNVGYALNLNGCSYCGETIKNKVFFDYSVGGFYCENCFNNTGREISVVTFNALKKAVNDEEISDSEAVFALRLLDFYVTNKTEESLSTLKQLLKF